MIDDEDHDFALPPLDALEIERDYQAMRADVDARAARARALRASPRRRWWRWRPHRRPHWPWQPWPWTRRETLIGVALAVLCLVDVVGIVYILIRDGVRW